jgi:hypothetical protein
MKKEHTVQHRKESEKTHMPETNLWLAHRFPKIMNSSCCFANQLTLSSSFGVDELMLSHVR